MESTRNDASLALAYRLCNEEERGDDVDGSILSLNTQLMPPMNEYE